MPSGFPSRIFVAGIDTDAGKTLVSALLCAGIGAHYWKPVQAGRDPYTDSQWVAKAAKLPSQRVLPEAFVLEMPASPHAAAEAEGIVIREADLRIPKTSGPLVIEGAGGLMVPLRRDWTCLDWLEGQQIPVLLVVKTYLGSINHSLLSLEALRARGIPLAGLVFNHGGRPESKAVIAEHAGVPVWADLPRFSDTEMKDLKGLFELHFKMPVLG